MIEVRCVKCKRLLMKAQDSIAEIKCPKCGYINHIVMGQGLCGFISEGGPEPVPKGMFRQVNN